MAKFSLSPQFIKEVWQVFRRRPLKEILFGKRVEFDMDEQEFARMVGQDFSKFQAEGARKGQWVKISLPHQGSGLVYLLPNHLGNKDQESLIVFDHDTKIVPGPDLWVYLSTNADVKKDGLGEIIDLGLLKGSRGGQTYVVAKPIKNLNIFKSAVIYCKQFEELFTFAELK